MKMRAENAGRTELEKQLSIKSVDLLGRSISGGMMGGYMEKGYPLYFVNDRLLRYLDYSYDEFVAAIGGLVINGMHPDDRGWVEKQVNRSLRETGEYEIRYRMLKKDGSYIWVNDVGKLSRDEGGREVCMSVIRDISSEVEATRELKRQIAEKEAQFNRYDHLFQSVLCGIVQYYLQPDGTVIFKDANREAIRIFGYTPEEFWEKTDWRLPDLIAAEDRERILALTTRSGEAASVKRYEYRLRRKDGDSCWIIGTAEVIEKHDESVLIQSVYLDIDEKKRTEDQNLLLSQQVEAGNRLLEMVLHNTRTFECYYYPQEAATVFPERACRYFGCLPRYEDMPGSFAKRFVDEPYRQGFFEMHERILRGEASASCTFRFSGGEKWCRATISTIQWDESGKPLGTVGIVEDITREEEMGRELEKIRSRDSLTGLYSKETGVARIREYMGKKSPRQVCAMMMLDMDDFSRLNQEEGATYADAVLQETAEILRAMTAPDDILVRLGGDEFMLFIKDCDKARATTLGPAIARRIEALYTKEGRGISASIGMCVTAVVDEYDGLYRCAESALSYVKENGKGKAACYLDTSVELGAPLTQLYQDEYTVNEIDSPGPRRPEDMMDFALELLGKSKKLDDAIFLLLARIGRRYNLDRVSVIEAVPEYLSFRYTYQWAKNKVDSEMGRDFYLTRERFEAVPFLFDEEGIYEGTIGEGSRMGSCLQAAIWNQGIYAGSLMFETRAPRGFWPEEERRLVKEMGKLIASFLMKARADAVSRAKTDFLSRMSHEIRTPMNAISGMTSIAKAVMDDREKLNDCLNKIESANEYLLRLINDILDMSRIESGRVEIHPEDASLSGLLGKLQALMSPQAAGRGLELLFHNEWISERPVRMDVLKLNQVLINIIGNAVKFTDPGGRIEVSVKALRQGPADVELAFSVADTGIGISRSALGRIFNVFEQGGRDTAAKYGGTGLGLSISSRLVQLMGGVLEVQSEEGKGSRFYFTLRFPFAERAAPKEAEAEPEPLEPGGFGGRRILLAEDNELNAEIAQTLLTMHGFLVECAGNGAEAVERFSSHEAGYYDAVLMDIRMPVMDGLEATRKIRTLGKEDSRLIPIIAMTANAFDEDTKKSMESGMNGHLTKPIVVDKLLDLLRTCLGGRRKDDAHAL